MDPFYIVLILFVLAGVTVVYLVTSNTDKPEDIDAALAKVQQMKRGLSDLYSTQPRNEKEKQFSEKLDELQKECYKQIKEVDQSNQAKGESTKLILEISSLFYHTEKSLRAMFFGNDENTRLGFSSTERDEAMSCFLMTSYYFDEAYESFPPDLRRHLEPPLKLSGLRTFTDRANYLSEREMHLKDALKVVEGKSAPAR